jgi:hypothetical protein
MNLVHEFTLDAARKPPLPIGAGPIGTAFTNPRLETGDERYAWVSTTFFVGQGHILPGRVVEYRVSRPA